MLRLNRRTRPGNYPVLQVTALGCSITGRTSATTTKRDPQHTFLLQEDNSLEHNFKCFWLVEAVEQSTMTTEQRVCEQHFTTHTKQQTEDLLSVSQQRGIPSNFNLLASLKNDDYMQFNVEWNEIHNSSFSTIISLGNIKDKIIEIQ